MLPQRIVAVGASIVFGRVDPEHGGFMGRMKIWHEKFFTPNAVFNLGISGETSTMLLDRLHAELLVRKPNLIIISVGLNDVKRNGSLRSSPTTPTERFRQNIHDIIHQSRNLCDVMFISITPINESKTTPLLYQKNSYIMFEDVVKYADITKAICMEEKVPYLDIMNQWLQMRYQAFLDEDGLHPNPLGHKDIFIKLKAFLKEQYSV